MSTCISLIRQYVPGSETSGLPFAHLLSLLLIVEALSVGVVNQRRTRFDQIPDILCTIPGQEEPECTAA